MLGGLAIAAIAMTLGVSELEDYRDELDASDDPTLSSTGLSTCSEIHALIDFWEVMD